MILRWAIRLANAMERTLLVPMIASHSNMWQGYDAFSISEMASPEQVLDLDALNAGCVHGIRIFRHHLRNLSLVLPGTMRKNEKPSSMWLKENAIRTKWLNSPQRIVFWRKSSMWECCAGVGYLLYFSPHMHAHIYMHVGD